MTDLGSSAFEPTWMGETRDDAPARSWLHRGDPLTARFASAADLPAMTAQMAGLAARGLEPNVFLEPAFLEPALAGLGRGRVELLTVHEGDLLVGALPVVRDRFRYGLPVGLVRAWTHPYAVLSTPLLDAKRASAALRAMLKALAGSGERALLLPLLPTAGPTAELVDTVTAELGLASARFDAHERAVLATELDAPAYLSLSVSAKKRKEYRRQRRRLGDELGGVTFEVHGGPPEVERATAAFLSLEAAGWKGRSGTALASRPAERTFFGTALRRLSLEGRVLAASLRAGDTIVAVGFVLLSGRGAFYWKTAYDEALARFSPGVLMTLELTEALIEQGHGAHVDSCAVAGHPMIDHVWRERLGLHDRLIALHPSLSGLRFQALATAERARRAARAQAKSLFHTLRRRISA